MGFYKKKSIFLAASLLPCPFPPTSHQELQILSLLCFSRHDLSGYNLGWPWTHGNHPASVSQRWDCGGNPLCLTVYFERAARNELILVREFPLLLREGNSGSTIQFSSKNNCYTYGMFRPIDVASKLRMPHVAWRFSPCQPPQRVDLKTSPVKHPRTPNPSLHLALWGLFKFPLWRTGQEIVLHSERTLRASSRLNSSHDDKCHQPFPVKPAAPLWTVGILLCCQARWGGSLAPTGYLAQHFYLTGLKECCSNWIG